MSGKLIYESGVSEARMWATTMVLREARGPGDSENAMRRLEHRYGIPWRTFHNLKYRAPADVLVGVWRQLKAAYEAECQRQERLLAHERHVAETKVLAGEAVARTAAYVDSGEGI